MKGHEVTTTPPMEDVRVFHRSGQWCPGRRIGEVAVYDMWILPEYQAPGRPTIDRSYLLLDQGIQLTRPVVFEGPVEGWWYIDLVEVEPTANGLIVHDLYVDLLVPPSADRYQVLDLDELGEAFSNGQITAAQCTTVLGRTQRFIAQYLNTVEQSPADLAFEFPPAGIKAFESLPCLLEAAPGTDM